MPAVARRDQPNKIARPLKVLVPLIKSDLERGDKAGLDYYRSAGDKLREARTQVPPHRWASWLTKNFALSRMTAWRYMRLSERAEDEGERIMHDTTLHEVAHGTKSDASRRIWDSVRTATARVDVEPLTHGRESRENETQLHRDLALELIDIGYKALATRLHPDRGGSKDAMRRLNRVREELKSVAETRRFE